MTSQAGQIPGSFMGPIGRFGCEWVKNQNDWVVINDMYIYINFAIVKQWIEIVDGV